MNSRRVKRRARQMHRARRIAWATFVAMGSVLLVNGALWLGSMFVELPTELLQPTDRTLTLLDRHGREIATVASGRARAAETIGLHEMGAWLPKITIALEDRRFHHHDGVDLFGIVAAAARNLRAGRVISGASTIPQQLIKNTRPRSGPRWWDKVREGLTAQRLARAWSKDRILEEYLNRIDYGNRRVGPKAAAHAYFAKEPADLTLAEAIFLAGLPQAPTRFNPWSRPAAARTRYERSVRVLANAGVVDAPTARELLRAPPEVTRRVPAHEAPHFTETIAARWPQLRGRIATTLDLPLQQTVAALAAAHVTRLQGRNVQQAAVVVIDNRDGGVRALVGSAGETSAGAQINGALLPRSSGSVLKPFLYAEAIERRVLMAASILPDTPDAIRGAYVDYDPQNFDSRFLGPVRVREALGNSLNVPAVYALSRIGGGAFFGRLGEWGFRFPRELKDYGAGLILGNAEPRLIDVAAAFSAFASEGRVPTWRLLETEPRTGRVVISRETAAIVADMLCDDEARRRAFGRGSALAVPVRVPCKTGTSSAFRDAWTVGSTKEHTVAVWAGNFDGRPMDAVTSIEAAAPLWRAVIDELLKTDDGVPVPVEGEMLIARDVCRLTGRRPVASSPGVMREWFLRGTEPREDAAMWLREGSMGASARLVLPAEYRAWCGSVHNFLGASAESEATIRIRTPAENADYALDPILPRTQQRLKLEALGSGGDALTWTVNGKAVPTMASPTWWTLEPGRHVAEVTDGKTSARVRFSVRSLE